MSPNPHDPKLGPTSDWSILAADTDANPRWLLPAVIALLFLTGALVTVAVTAI